MPVTVITSGTDGIGRALATTYLERGHDVLIIGTSPAKGGAFLSTAAAGGAGDRAHFLPADLSLVAENRRVVEWITEHFPAVDVLILGARYHRSTRVETSDGLESNFALYYLSRYLLSHGLVPLLKRADHPVVLNFGGSGLTGRPRWNDLQLRRNYPGTGALGHSAALCDLLGVHFTALYPEPPIHYVLNHPGVVSTSFAGEYDAATAAHVDGLRTSGKPVALAVAQILPFLDSPATGLSAVLEGKALPVNTPAFDRENAAALHELTEKLLADLPVR
jgi:NAD(P)-dependent dehydrogenase (short-subunit alcohol dehydrogenase family)